VRETGWADWLGRLAAPTGCADWLHRLEEDTVTRLDLLHLRPHQGAHRVAARAAVSVFVPLAAVTVAGHPEWSAYAAFGAFASLYGRNHRHLSRATMQATAGAALVVAVVTGVLVGCLPSPSWWAVPVAAAIAFAGSHLARAQDWHPPGSLFLVFAFGGCSAAPHVLGDVVPAVAVTVGSAVFALVVGAVGGLVTGPRRPKAPPLPLVWSWSWLPVRDSVAVLVAGATAVGLGIGHPYWAMVSAVAPLGARGVTGQLGRAVHRVVGTLLGLLPAAALLALDLRGVALVLLVAVLQFATELLVGRNYGLALLFITPLALLMGQTAHHVRAGGLLLDRGVETVVGSVVGVAVLAAVHALARRTAAPSG
jgi:hypothetical protein